MTRFVLGFDTPGVIAHSDHLWNILGMYTVGLAATQELVAGAASANGKVACIICIAICLVIAFANKRSENK